MTVETYIPLSLALLLTLAPSLASAHAQPPQYQCDQPAITQALDDFWTLQGLGQTTGDIKPNWGALLGSSDWFEWDSLKINWTDDWADKNAQRNLLLHAHITGVNAAGAQATGYVWPSNGSESWLCPTPHFDQMPRFVCAVFNDYLWSRDRAFLQKMKPKIEAVMDDMTGTMGGRSGLPRCPGVFTGLPNVGPNTTYMDCYREGGTVAWIDMGYGTALQDMAALENALGDRKKSAIYAAYARKFPAQFDAQLWNRSTHRYAGWRDSGGALHDYGFTYLNLEALARGLGTGTQAARIFDWLDNGRAWPTMMGGHVGSTDIYQCVVAPRSNTVPIPAADWDPWSVPQALRRSTMGYGALVEDGGAMLWVNFYDVTARLRWLDADSAWGKFADMLFRVQGDPLRFTEGVTHPTNVYGEHYLEVGPADGPENGLAGTSPLYGFMGIGPKPDGLYASPNLPTSLLSLIGRNVCYGSATVSIQVSRGRIVTDTAEPGLFHAPSAFNKLGLRLSNVGRVSVRLQKRARTRRGDVWNTLASSSVTAQHRNVFRYFPLPVQTAGTYRMLGPFGPAVCRAAFEPTAPGSAGALRGRGVALTARHAFSEVALQTPGRRVGSAVLLRKLGDGWRPVAATWTAGSTGGVLGFADQPPGLYRLRSANAVIGTYRLLSSRYTVVVTNGAVSTTSTVAAGSRVKLNVVPGAPVGHRIVIASPLTAATPKDVFDVYDAGRGQIALQSERTGRYLSVGAGKGNILQTLQATAIGPRERFVWRHQTSGSFALYSPAAGHYVSTDLSHNGRLSAGFALVAGSWERFTWADRGAINVPESGRV